MRKLPSISSVDASAPRVYSKLPARLLVLGALIAAICLFAFITVPGSNALFIHFWVYLALAALPLLLLLAALTVKLYQSIRSKWPRYITTWAMVTLLLCLIAVVSTMCMMYTVYSDSPAAYYTHTATGNRLVIMKYTDASTVDENGENGTLVYSAYPMINKLFYQADRGKSVHTNTGVDYVEWSEDGSVATVYLTDTQGEQQTIEVDFSAE